MLQITEEQVFTPEFGRVEIAVTACLEALMKPAVEERHYHIPFVEYNPSSLKRFYSITVFPACLLDSTFKPSMALKFHRLSYLLAIIIESPVAPTLRCRLQATFNPQ